MGTIPLLIQPMFKHTFSAAYLILGEVGRTLRSLTYVFSTRSYRTTLTDSSFHNSRSVHLRQHNSQLCLATWSIGISPIAAMPAMANLLLSTCHV